MNKININEKFNLFSDEWTPKILAESNGQLVKIAKATGELVWHKHDNEDELKALLATTGAVEINIVEKH